MVAEPFNNSSLPPLKTFSRAASSSRLQTANTPSSQMVDTANFARLRDHSSDQVLKTNTVAPISAGGSLKPVDLN